VSCTARALASLAAILLASVAVAQEPAPKGPADIINRAREGAAQQDMRDAVRAGEEATPEAADGTAEEGAQPAGATEAAHAGMDQAALRRVMGQGPKVATAEPTGDVPAGAVRVHVVDGQGRPVAGQTVRLGIMVAEGGRRSETRETSAEGVALFDELPTGNDQSYRASILHDGAQVGAPPFQLPLDKGYDVRLIRLPVTRDARVLLQLMGQTILELRENRLRVTQQAQLTNMDEQTYVFPEEGHEVRLPEGFTAFQSQPVMTDQRLVPTETGFRVHGSLPPGPVNLMWAFDLPIEGTRLAFDVEVPWRTYVYRVVVDAIEGLQLEASDMPAARPVESRAGKLLLTQVERGPDLPPLDRINVRLTGIPGPGPWRWLAVGGGLLGLLLGVVGILRSGRDLAAEARAREERKQQLLAEAVELEQQRAGGEIGPSYHQRRMDAVKDELAAILKLEARDEGAQPAASATDKAPAH
jgi:hypothetical protein